MTRKNFLQTMAGAAASAYIPVPSAADAAPKPKRGVSLYSYQEEYYTGKMTLEDCIAEVANMGADVIEILAEEMVPNFPNPPDSWVGHWHELMAKYKVRPNCYDNFLEMKLYKNRPLTMKESVDMMVRDLKLAKRLGFKTIRCLRAVPADVCENAVRYAEEYDIRIGAEIHAPYRMSGEWFEQRMEVIQKTKTKHFGFVPDMGIFLKRMPPVWRARNLRDGLPVEVANYVDKAFADGVPQATAAAEIARMGFKEGDHGIGAYLSSAYQIHMENPKDLLRIIPYIFNIHAKFYEMTSDFHETAIPYEEIVPVLIQGGYGGYLSSEYEGQRSIQDAFETNSCEQVRRQHVMLRRLLGEV